MMNGEEGADTLKELSVGVGEPDQNRPNRHRFMGFHLFAIVSCVQDDSDAVA